MSEEEKKAAAQQKINQNSVMRYLTIMFAAAFVLLFITFAMERRQYEALQAQSQEQIDHLQQSITATQSLNDLYEENSQLKDQLNDLTNRLEDAEEALANVQHSYELLQIEVQMQESSVVAMDWFWQINEAYVRNRTDLCIELIHSMEQVGFTRYLPRESATGTDRFSPYDRFVEIRSKMIPTDENP